MTKTRNITDIDMTVRFVQRQQLKKELDNNIHDWLHSYTQMVEAEAVESYKGRCREKFKDMAYTLLCTMAGCTFLGFIIYIIVYGFLS